MNEYGINERDMNGNDLNGNDLNGYDMNERDMNRRDMNGHDMNGHDMNGHDMNGHDMKTDEEVLEAACKRKRKKMFNLGIVHTTVNRVNDVTGLVLRRDLTTRECCYILQFILGIDISLFLNEAYDKDEEKAMKDEYTDIVNKWLRGDVDDSAITELAQDCSDEPLGMFNLIRILKYLKEREIIS